MKRSQSVLKGASVSQMELGGAYSKAEAWFFSFPQKEFTLNEIAGELSISKTTAHEVISHLAEAGFLTVTRLGRLWRIKANQDHQWFETRKIPFNLGLVYGCGIVPWVDATFPQAKTIVLMGSYRRGDDTEQSDLDIAVEIGENKGMEMREETLAEMGYRKDVRVNIILFSRTNVDLNLFANIANGIILRGFLEVRP